MTLRIRTQFILTMLLFVVILAVISAEAVITNQRVVKVTQQENIAVNIAQGAGEISYLANDYVIYRESQQLERWQARFASFSKDINSLQANNVEQQALVQRIRANAQRLRDVFDSIVSAAGSPTQNPGPIDPALLRVSWSRLAVQSQALVSDASHLSQLLRQEMDRIMLIRTVLIYVVLSLFVALLLLGFGFIYRRLLGSIAKLQAGAAVIGSGNLDFRIAEKKNDEIGDLSHAFNRMTADLKLVTASKAELEREITGRNEVEEELRVSNEHLQDQTRKLEEEIEERKRVQSELESASVQRQMALDAARMGWWRYDPVKRYYWWDERYKEIFGFAKYEKPSDEILATRLHPEDRPGVRAKAEAALDPVNPQPYLAEYRITLPGGTIKWIEAHGAATFEGTGRNRKATSLVGTVADITERKKSEEEISHLASFPELNPNPIIEIDELGNVEYMNPAAARLFPDFAEEGGLHPLRANWEPLAGALRQEERPFVERDIAVGENWYLETVVYTPLKRTYRFYIRDITARKRAEEALAQLNRELEERVYQRSEEALAERQRLYNVLEALPAYVVLLDKDYHVPFANKFFRERFGESHGKCCFEYLFNRSEPCEDCESYKAMRIGRPHHWEWLGPDGRNYDIYDYPFKDSDGSMLILEMGIDITERKKAEAALTALNETLEQRVLLRTAELRETRDYLDNLFNYANAPIIVWNPDFKITRFNHAFERLTGQAAEQVLGEKVDLLFPGESREASMKHIREASAGQPWETVEIPIMHQDGTVRLLLWNSATLFAPDTRTPVATIAQGQDITGRKQAEEALKESEQRWITTLSSIGDAVIATDTAGKVTFMNRIAESLTGWAFQESAGRQVTDVFNIINEETRGAVDSPASRVIREGLIVGLANHTILVKKDGTEVPIDDSGAPIRYEGGEIRGVVLVFRDITERRKADQIKDEFIGMVSHELRTPLTVVTGAIHTAMLAGLPPEELPLLLKEAALGAESLADILDNLLELSRYQAQRLVLAVEPMYIKEIIDNVIGQLKGKSSIHRLIADVPGQLPPVHGDKMRVERVLHNLIENAIKYSPQGGKVRIFTRQDSGSLIVGVSDRGIGIAPEDRARLFQPFLRLENSAQRGIKGLGLGLIVCRRLVEAHNGRIWVESEPGKGSTFYFSIPLGQRKRPT